MTRAWSRPGSVRPRILLAVTAVTLSLLAVAAAIVPSDPAPTPVAGPALSDRLGPKTWAFAIPVAWLATPLPTAHDDDVLDVLGARPGERATASQIATGLRVMSVDERAVVVELTAEDATAIASARARGLSLVAILRSTR